MERIMTDKFESSFGYTIHRYAPLALSQLKQAYDGDQGDKNAMETLRNRNISDEARCEVIKKWMHNYNAFQGISDADRTTLAMAIVHWADARILQADLNIEGL